MKRAETLIDIAAAVGDGAAVDWDRVDRQSDPAARIVVGHLRLVERIASLHSSHPVEAFGRSLHDSLQPTMARPPAGDIATTWGPLTIVELIGKGSYADVYLARDPRLDRPVALKLLRHRDSRHAAAESQAIDEARLLARIDHPNVVTVYGAERIDGRAGIWMEFVEGRTLEQELRECGPLPADDIVAIGIALSSAVAAVHAAGLLHRDIKTQNVMRGRDGRIRLTDFGTTREAAGNVVELAGTPLYLAPEVLRGEPSAVASDIYSLGVLLYHLATGTFPVSGRSLADLRDAHATNVRVPVLQRRPDLPKRLAAVIARATDPIPKQRYGSAAALGTAVADSMQRNRRPLWAAAAAAAALALATLVLVAPRWPGDTGGRTPRAVLVAAFDNETGDPRLDDIVQVAFAQELMQSRALTVVPPEQIEDSLRLMKRPLVARLDARTAREVSIRDGTIQLIASGRIDRLDPRYAIRVTVSDVAAGALVAQASVEVMAVDEILDAVRTLAASVRTAIGDDRRQVDADLRLERATTGSLDALRAYTSGVAFVNDRQWAAAELRLAEAVRLDPSFASALIMLAHCQRNQQSPPEQYLQVAEQAFRNAEGLPSRERYFIEGSYHQMTGDLDRAIAAYEVLTREHPGDFWGLNNLALAYSASGRHREGIPIHKRLAQLRPHNVNVLQTAAARLIAAGGGLEAARTIVERASSLEPPPGAAGENITWLRFFPAFEAWADGRVEEAAAQLDALGAHPSDEDAGFVGALNLMLGRVREAERAWSSASSPLRRDSMLAQAALARGDVSGARALLAGTARQLIAARTVTGSGRAMAICWSLLRTGMVAESEQLCRETPQRTEDPWIGGELAAANGDFASALMILQSVQREVPPGAAHRLLAVDTLARMHEQRGDLLAAAETLRQTDGTQHTTYTTTGPTGFYWLQARAHLLKIERQLGRTARAEAIARELERLLVVADPDFAIRQVIQAR